MPRASVASGGVGSVSKATAVLATALLFALAGGCSPPENADLQEEIDLDDPVAGFRGSESCSTCHQAEFARWSESHHAKAMLAATDAAVLASFDGSTLANFAETATFTRNDEQFQVTIESPGDDTATHDLPFTFGLDPLQQFLAPAPGGRLQALPFAWDTRPEDAGGQRWFSLQPDEYIDDADALHWMGPNYNWNFMCAECHSTNVRMNYDAATDSFDTRFDEISVGCEACHGPGSTHIEQAERSEFDSSYGLAVTLDDRSVSSWVMNPDTGIAEHSGERRQQQVDSCGQCHSLRSPLLQEYAFGRPLADTHRVSLLEDQLYFADGQIREEVYVYGSFLQSRMFAAGVTCSDCHEPHSADLRAGDEPNDSCATCHLPERFAVPDHSRHDAGDAGCVDCHMPERTYMQVDERRDHSFRIPRPALSQHVDSTDACLACHTDRDRDWSVSAYAEHFGSEAPAEDHYGFVLEAARRGHANASIAALYDDVDTPPIVKATAVSLLRPPLSANDGMLIGSALDHADPLVRRSALEALALLPPETRIDVALPLLEDPIQSVRTEAARALADLGDLLPYAARNSFATAAAEYRSSLTNLANRAESLLALGNFERALGNQQAAETHYRAALAKDARGASARINLSDLLRSVGREAEAGALLEEGIELVPDDAALRYAYALHLVRRSETNAALDELRRAGNLAPDEARYAFALGIALNSSGNSAEAVRVLRTSATRFPRDYDIGLALATVLRDRGETLAAYETAARLAEAFPGDATALRLRDSLRQD